MSDFSFNLPPNTTSFGSISFSILREAYKRNLAPPLIPIGGIQLDAQKPDNDFNLWLQGILNKALKTHKRTKPSVTLWHTNQDSIKSISNEEIFITFIECDSLTEAEQNILGQKKTVFVTSTFLRDICHEHNLTNIKYLPLGFDNFNFGRIDKKFYSDDRIVWGIYGKAEFRKGTKKAIQAWLKKFGVPKVGVRAKHFLHAAIYNPFLVQSQPNGQVIDHNQQFMAECLMGKEWGNIQFYPWLRTNAEYNSLLNAAHIVIGLSLSECFGAPEFHSVAMGKHALMLNAHGYKDWANNDNSVLLEPSGKVIAEDGIFFRRDSIFQNGNFFDWNEDAAIAKFDEVVKRYESNPINTNGLELQKRTYKETFDQILGEL